MAFLIRINLLVGILILAVYVLFISIPLFTRNFSSSASKLGPDNKTPLVDYVMQMITGLLLSDASLVKKYANGGTYFQFAQSIIHQPFIELVHGLMFAAGLCNMTSPTIKTATVSGFKYLYSSFTTRSFKEWNELHHNWYPSGIKVLPDNISQLLTPISLAF